MDNQKIKKWFGDRYWRFWTMWMVWYAGFKISGGNFLAGFALLAVFFLGCLVYYCIKDMLVFIFGRIGPTNNYTTNVYTDTTPGHPDVEGNFTRHPDPTRPSHEDWAGMITYRVETRRHK